MVSAFEESGNPFNEGRQNLVILDSKEVMGETAVSSIREVQTITQSQYEMYVDERAKIGSDFKTSFLKTMSP